MSEAEGDGSEQPGNIIELEDALIGLVVRFGARTVAEKAQELYRHTKEWREQSAQPARGGQDAWDGAVRAQENRAQENRPRVGSARQQTNYEDAKRLLGG